MVHKSRFFALRLVWLLIFLSASCSGRYVYAQNIPLAQDTSCSTADRKLLRKRARMERKALKIKLKYKADSLAQRAKIAQRYVITQEELDSLKGVVKNSKELAKKELVRQAAIQELRKDMDPYLEMYTAQRDKILTYDSLTTIALINETKSEAQRALTRSENGRKLLQNTEKYTVFLPEKNNQLLDSAHRQKVMNELHNLAKDELEKQEVYREIKKELQPYLNSPYMQKLRETDLDSLTLDSLLALRQDLFRQLEKKLQEEIKKRPEFKELLKESKEFEKLSGLPEQYMRELEQFRNGEILQNKAMQEATARAKKLLEENMPQIHEAQAKLAKLKKKYSVVPSANDLSTATKRNSLKGHPLNERLVAGLNLQILSLEPVRIDFNPVLGYKLDKKAHLAIGATYRARFSALPGGVSQRSGRDELVYGYRAFGEYNIWRGLAVHGEYERLSKEFEVGNNGSDIFERKWVQGALLGISGYYRIAGKLQGNYSILYNLIYDRQQAVYQSPWVFRFGFNLK